MDRNKIIRLLKSGSIEAGEALELFEAFGIEIDDEISSLLGANGAGGRFGAGFENGSNSDADSDADTDANDGVDSDADSDGANYGEDFIKNLESKISKIEKKFEKLGAKFEEMFTTGPASDSGSSQKNNSSGGAGAFESAYEQSFAGNTVEIRLSHSDISLAAAAELSYRFVNLETGEIEEAPEDIIVYNDGKKLRITENFYKNIGSKVASGGLGKKVIDMIGLTTIVYPRYRVEVTIPEARRCSLVKLQTSSGNINASGINTVERLDLNNVSGVISVDDFIGEHLISNNVSGATNLTGVRVNRATIGSVSGGVKFIGKTPELALNTVSGKVVVANEMLLYKSSINTVSGAVHCYVRNENRQNTVISGLFKQSAKNRSNGEAGTLLRIGTVSGSVKLHDLSEFN